MAINERDPIPFAKTRVQVPPPLIEESFAVTRQLEQQIAAPPTPEPTYRSCVADGIDACRYLDVTGIAKEIMGDPIKPIETAADLADRMAEWAAANKRVAA